MRTLFFLLLLTTLALCLGAAGAFADAGGKGPERRLCRFGSARLHRADSLPAPRLSRHLNGLGERRFTGTPPPLPGLLPPEGRPEPRAVPVAGCHHHRERHREVKPRCHHTRFTRAGPGSESAVRKCGEFRFRVLNVHL